MTEPPLSSVISANKHLSHVLYWRFFVNLALMLIDAAMYIIAGATVLNLRHEATPFYSSRFNFTIDSTVYFMIVACFWVWSLYVAGIYHRHVMGDGYQLNVLLVKGMSCAGWCSARSATSSIWV